MQMFRPKIVLSFIGLFLTFPFLQVLAQEQKPNIIVFLVDDMGLMDTSLPFMTDGQVEVRYPQNDWFRTPNMERAARQGIRFSNFYALSVCSPSRTSIMTGQNSTRHGTTNWINSETNNVTKYGPKDWNWDGLSASDATLPKMLQQAGYKTIHVGKAHFGRGGSAGEDPRNIGFDVNVAGSSIGEPGSYYGESGYGHLKGSKNRAVPGLEKYHGTHTFLTEALTLEANDQITQSIQEDKPFFLHLAHYAVHTPWEEDGRFSEYYRYSEKSKPAKAFATLIEGMDKSLGDIMDHLERLGIAENTLILFLGDNGSDAPGNDDKGYTSSAPLRGKKGTEFEGGVRAPFIAFWGKVNNDNSFQKNLKIPTGRIQQQFGTVMDIYPTLLNLANVQQPKEHIVDGTDLKIQLEGNKNAKRSDRILMHFPHEHRGSYFTTYHEGNWKLIYYYSPENPTNPRYRLYDLKKDPGEAFDLSMRQKSRVKAMIKRMSEQLVAEGARFPADANGNVLKPFFKEI